MKTEMKTVEVSVAMVMGMWIVCRRESEKGNCVSGQDDRSCNNLIDKGDLHPDQQGLCRCFFFSEAPS